MTCRALHELLDRYLEGILDEWRAGHVENHLLSCGECRRLVALARGQAEVRVDPEFVGSVLERTTGASCARARELMCSEPDEPLEAVDSELLRNHLEHCSDCSEVDEVLAELHAELPGMAEIEPGPFFTSATLARMAATQGRRSRGRMRGLWAKLVSRPRFSWEAAYVGTLVLVLAVGNPVSLSFGSFDSAPRRAWNRVSKELPQAWEAWTARSAGSTAKLAAEFASVSSSVKHAAYRLSQQVIALKGIPDYIVGESSRLWNQAHTLEKH